MPFNPSEIRNPRETLARREAQAMNTTPDADQDTDAGQPAAHVVADPTTKRTTMSQADFSGYKDSKTTKKTSR
jgi:hypothetical protein